MNMILRQRNGYPLRPTLFGNLFDTMLEEFLTPAAEAAREGGAAIVQAVVIAPGVERELQRRRAGIDSKYRHGRLSPPAAASAARRAAGRRPPHHTMTTTANTVTITLQ